MEEVQLTQEEADIVGEASKTYFIETLSDIIKRGEDFSNISERLKPSNEVQADLLTKFSAYLERPAYVNEESRICILVIDSCFFAPTTASVEV